MGMLTFTRLRERQPEGPQAASPSPVDLRARIRDLEVEVEALRRENRGLLARAKKAEQLKAKATKNRGR